MKKNEKTDIAMFGVFFEQDLLEAKIGDAGTAVLFVGLHTQHALLAGLEKCFTVYDLRLIPAVDMRFYLIDQERSRCIAKHLMIFVKNCTIHIYLPVNLGLRFSKNAWIPSRLSSLPSNSPCNRASMS